MTINSNNDENFSQTFFIAPVIPRLLAGEEISENENTQLNTSTGVATATTAYQELMARWELPLYLMGGTLAMRKAKRKYLPQEPGEEDSLYEARLKRTILYGIYSKTIRTLASIPFIDPIICENVPQTLEYLKTSCTDNGESLAEFAQQLLEDALNLGIAHFLVDFTRIPDIENMNLAEERALGARSYFARIDPVNILGWVFDITGRLAQIRIYEYATIQGEDFSEVHEHQVRVITPTEFTLYRLRNVKIKDKRGSAKETQAWVADEPIPNPLGFIPLVTFYGNKDGEPMRATPVMEELAWLNLRHYQKLSDLDNIEHVANTPFLFAKGFEADELEDVVVGVNSLVSTTSEQADIKYVEHTGAAINASQNSIKELEKRAVVMGADFLAQTATSRQTAYAKSVDTGKTLSVLQAIVNNLSEALAKGYKIAGSWEQLTPEETEELNINVGEGIDLSLDDNDIAHLKTLADEGYLTVESLQFELQRRGKISDSTRLKKPKKPKVEPIPGQESQVSQDNTGEDVDG